MKKIYLLYIVLISLATTSLIGCSDWTESEAKTFPESIVSDEYYAALRAYKQTDHQVAFGWFGGWSGEGAFMKSSLAGIPDSVDIVSIWDNGTNLSEAQRKDMAFCQNMKGTKIIYCSIIGGVGDKLTPQNILDNWKEMGYNSKQEAINDFWGYPSDESNIEAVETSIRKYAKAIVDTLNLYGYDGFDIDYEPVAGPYTGNIVNSDEHLFFFIDELGKYLGPKSGTGKLLVIDGEPQRISTKPGIGTYFDYFIIQAYNPGGDSNLDGRLIDGNVWGPALIATFNGVMSEEEITRRTIMTENFEATDAAMDGGYPYTDRYGNSMKSLEGMARWQPRNGFRKGGVGTYHMEAEFGTSPEYKNIRRAIQIMNPSSHSLLKN
ncbi:glycoside hydrolase family 18 [Bacteroides sp.]|uniref:glycoside hydrolase family 18 n=1 Tax=Bacteroides sp. TaxID=29523 RepID=UPI002A81829F|nr:glycoside hydrolase family 18 [Bacteroides sp.]